MVVIEFEFETKVCFLAFVSLRVCKLLWLWEKVKVLRFLELVVVEVVGRVGGSL